MSSSIEWYWTCNNKKFKKKLDAVKESSLTGQMIYFHAPTIYNKHSLWGESALGWQEILKQRALEIRQSYGYLRLWFSGGCDSTTMLDSFVKNNIFIDEIIIKREGIGEGNFEQDDYAIPYIEKIKHLIPNTKITIVNLDKNYLKSFYREKDWWRYHIGYLSFRPMDKSDSDDLQNIKHSAINIIGREKPQLVFANGKWYAYFLDNKIWPLFSQEDTAINFYSDDPVVHSKQCHMLKRYLEKNFQPTDYNTTQAIVGLSQQTVNYGSGRLKNENEFFLLKRYASDAPIVDNEGNSYLTFTLKDKLSLQSIVNDGDWKPIIKKWNQGFDILNSEYDRGWFNQRDPRKGFVGVFSKFYCLDFPEIKTLDELFPNGFFNDQ